MKFFMSRCNLWRLCCAVDVHNSNCCSWVDVVREIWASGNRKSQRVKKKTSNLQKLHTRVQDFTSQTVHRSTAQFVDSIRANQQSQDSQSKDVENCGRINGTLPDISSTSTCCRVKQTRTHCLCLRKNYYWAHTLTPKVWHYLSRLMRCWVETMDQRLLTRPLIYDFLLVLRSILHNIICCDFHLWKIRVKFVTVTVCFDF